MEQVEVPLAGWLARRAQSAASPQQSPTDASAAPRVNMGLAGGDSVGVEKLRKIKLQEVLGLVFHGQATVRVPLVPRTLGLGPFSVSVVAGQQMVVRFAVEAGLVPRNAARGTVEPPVALPLGVGFNGIRLGRDGALVADISRFPDLNLSELVLKGRKIPEGLRDTLEMVFSDRPSSGASSGEPKSAPLVDTKGIRVQAVNVVPRPEPLVLGENTRLNLGADTLLDITWADNELHVRGLVCLADAVVGGTGFHLEGVTGRGQADLRMVFAEGRKTMELTVTDLDATITRGVVDRANGTQLVLGPLQTRGGRLTLQRHQGQPQHLTVDFPDVEGRLEGGHVMALLNDNPLRVDVMPTALRGSLRVHNGEVEVKADVLHGGLAATDIELPLDVAHLGVEKLTADVGGQVSYVSGEGLQFDGQLAVHANVGNGTVGASGAQAALAQGTRLELNVAHLATRQNGLALRGSGVLNARLRQGHVPLPGGATLQFSQGAQARLVLDTLTLTPESPPQLDAQLHLVARSDPVSLGRSLALPAGQAHVAVEGISVGPEGVLRMRGIRVELDAPAENGPLPPLAPI